MRGFCSVSEFSGVHYSCFQNKLTNRRRYCFLNLKTCSIYMYRASCIFTKLSYIPKLYLLFYNLFLAYRRLNIKNSYMDFFKLLRRDIKLSYSFKNLGNLSLFGLKIKFIIIQCSINLIFKSIEK